jgi:mannose/cellobiose epimerase-like protein (N-acyl-D-glucosamine 2-epimerase family)
MKPPYPIIRFDDARRFLVDEALPFWSTRGAYENGCFVERLDLAGRPVDPGFTRVRVQARQIYVFSHAQHLGLFSARELCNRAVDFFIGSAWLGADRGWAKLIDRMGSVIDPSPDLYDIAFALFALAWHYRVTKDSRCLEIAHETLDFMEKRMKHAHGGYLNDAESSFPRLQNPHMHLVEAMCAWMEASGDKRFAALASQLVDLFDHRFHDRATGTLGEYFGEDWTPVADERGDFVEPGHQFEWAWIIAHYGRLSGAPRLDIVSRLIGSALSTGFEPKSALTVDVVSRRGHILDASRRLWPQTEALKAALAQAEFLGQPVSERIAGIVDTIIERFLRPGPLPGSWIDHYNEDWSIKVDKVPATSLYHVALAFFELLRLREKLETPAAKAAPAAL